MRKTLAALSLAALLSGCATTQSDNPSYSPLKASEANAELGVTYLQRGMLDQAKLKLEKSMQQNPKNAVAVSGYGMLMARLQRAEEAERHFRRALELDPESSEIRNNYGTFLCEQERYEDARRNFLEAARNPLYRTPEFAYANLGECLLDAGDKDEAELQFIAALQANAQFSPALYRLADMSFEKGDYKAAANYIERYHQAARQSPESLWLAVRIYSQLDDRGQIASYALKLKRRFPESREAALLAELESSRND